jgi:hypothetical protein
MRPYVELLMLNWTDKADAVATTATKERIKKVNKTRAFTQINGFELEKKHAKNGQP